MLNRFSVPQRLKSVNDLFLMLANDLLIIKLIYQVFKPERPENHYVQNKYFQNRKRYYVQNNQYHQYYKTNDQFRKKRDFMLAPIDLLGDEKHMFSVT